MRVFSWDEVGQGLLLPHEVWATMGVFDGLHLGHRALIRQILSGPGRTSLVISFRQNPKKVLYRETYPGDLMVWEEKQAALEALGVEAVLLIDFSRDFSKMSGRDFFLRLKRSFQFGKIVLGWDFSFGKDAATAASEIGWLADPQTELEILPPVEVDSQVVSSSIIRKAVLQGDFALVRRFLEQPYSLDLHLPGGYPGGRVWFPRSDYEKVLPLTGVYKALVDGQNRELVFEKDGFFWESPPDVLYKKLQFL